uniref:Uncharacterized protein n=1 Tax=Tetraselmis sp. GSL018 TaxID=582737 RepID=A0A061QTB1_9CHLO
MATCHCHERLAGCKSRLLVVSTSFDTGLSMSSFVSAYPLRETSHDAATGAPAHLALGRGDQIVWAGDSPQVDQPDREHGFIERPGRVARRGLSLQQPLCLQEGQRPEHWTRWPAPLSCARVSSPAPCGVMQAITCMRRLPQENQPGLISNAAVDLRLDAADAAV